MYMTRKLKLRLKKVVAMSSMHPCLNNIVL